MTLNPIPSVPEASVDAGASTPDFCACGHLMEYHDSEFHDSGGACTLWNYDESSDSLQPCACREFTPQ